METWSNAACNGEKDSGGEEDFVDIEGVEEVCTQVMIADEGNGRSPFTSSSKKEEETTFADHELASSRELDYRRMEFFCKNCKENFNLENMGPYDGEIPLYGDDKAEFVCSKCRGNYSASTSSSHEKSSSCAMAAFIYPEKRPWAEVAFVALINLAIQYEGSPTPKDGTFYNLQSDVDTFIYQHFDTLCNGYPRNCWKSHLATALNMLPSHFEHAPGQQGKGWWRLREGAKYPTEKDKAVISREPSGHSPWSRTRTARLEEANSSSSPSSSRLNRKRAHSGPKQPVRTGSASSTETVSNPTLARSLSVSDTSSGDNTPRYTSSKSHEAAFVRIVPKDAKRVKRCASISDASPLQSRAHTLRNYSSYDILSSTNDSYPQRSLHEEMVSVESLGPIPLRFVKSRLGMDPFSPPNPSRVKDLRRMCEAALSMGELSESADVPSPFESLRNAAANDSLSHHSHPTEFQKSSSPFSEQMFFGPIAGYSSNFGHVSSHGHPHVPMGSLNSRFRSYPGNHGCASLAQYPLTANLGSVFPSVVSTSNSSTHPQ